MTHVPATPPDEGYSERASRLEEALTALSHALAILDELNLSAIAPHVSFAHELGKEHLGTFRKGSGFWPEEAGIN